MTGPSDDDSVAVLRVLAGECALEHFVLSPGSFDLGRHSDCAVHLPENPVSRRHARIVCEDSLCFVEDLGSKNGTQLNGTNVTKRTVLTDGDVLRVGGYELRFELAGQLTAELRLPGMSHQRAFSTRDEPGQFLVITLGSFTEHRYADIQHEANRVVSTIRKARPPRVIVDLTAVTMLSSVGIGVIVSFAREAKAAKARPCLCGASESVLQILQTMNLFKLWPHFETLDAALNDEG